jgi:hypothetical protein
MYAASAAFKAEVRKSHTSVAIAEVWNADRKLATLAIDKGRVAVSTSNTIRRTCEIHLTTDRTIANLVPTTGFDNITPFGNELKLFRGIKYLDGTTEYIPLGVFAITDVMIKDTNNGVEMSIQGQDRSLYIQRARWSQPYQMLSTTLEASITAMLQYVYPNTTTNFPTTNVTVQQIVFGADNSNDPWSDAVSLAALVGYDLFFDVTGVAVLKKFPDTSTASVAATYVEGKNTLITAIDRTISSKDTFNGVIYTVSGSKITTPIRVEVWDEDTTSPTYRYGVFGQAPTFINSSVLQTTAEATAAATALLYTYIGAQEQINWISLVDPCLDANDVVYVATNGSKVSRLLIIDAIDIPLESSGTMNATARTVRYLNASDTVTVGTS